MANKADPYTQRFPTRSELIGPSGYMQKEWLDWFNYDNLWKQQIWQKIGGGSDAVSDNDIGFSYQEALSYNKIFNEISISANRTTCGDEMIRATAACTITLNPTPDDGEIVKVQPDGNFKVTISGSINGGSQLIMNGAYDLAELQYSVEFSEWVIK